MKALYQILVMLCACVLASAQPAHQVPFASSNNAIELAIHNSSTVPVSHVKVEATNVPAWLRFTSTGQTIKQLKEKEGVTAVFCFSIEKTAPVNKPQTITFTITSSTGEQWTKQLTIAVNPPDHFELFRNYPNPFNPSTTISYQLPKDEHIVLKIYNSIGQEVTTLVNDDRLAGYHQEVWNASNVASGMYIYQLSMNNGQGKKEFYRKKMLLVK
jgi:hypothetical protein